MKAFPVLIALAWLISSYLCGCGTTIRLDYTGKGGESIGVGFTLPDRKSGYRK